MIQIDDEVRKQAEMITEHCLQRAEAQLQCVFVYGSDSVGTVYVRDQTAEVLEPTELSEFANVAEEIQQSLDAVEPLIEETALGEHQMTMHMFENSFVLQFGLGKGTGVIVAFDPSIGKRLKNFSEECWQAINHM